MGERIYRVSLRVSNTRRDIPNCPNVSEQVPKKRNRERLIKMTKHCQRLSGKIPRGFDHTPTNLSTV